ncbi:MAG: cell division protein FtsK [Eubacteriaceae bacterium]|nr:cell division protein FtsK [Eubacteriaceae bacterium]
MVSNGKRNTSSSARSRSTSKSGAGTNRRTAASKSAETRKQNEEERALRTEVRGFILLALCILLWISLFWSQGGVVTGYIRTALSHLFGSTGSVCVVTAMTLSALKKLISRPRGRVWLYIAASCVALTVSVYLNEFADYALNERIMIRDMWTMSSSGGFLFSVAARYLRYLLPPAAIYMFLAVGLIASFILVYHTSVVGAVRTAGKKAKETATDIRERISQKARERSASRTLDFEKEPAPRETSVSKPRVKEGSTIDLRRTSTVLETKNGDKLIYVKKGALSPGEGNTVPSGTAVKLDDFSQKHVPGEKSPRKRQTPEEVGESLIRAARKREEGRKDETEAPGSDRQPEKITAADNESAREEVTKKIESSKSSAPPRYRYPSYSLLKPSESVKSASDEGELKETAVNLIKALEDFGVEANITDVTVGPAVTRFELTIQSGTRVKKVADLADDIAYALAAKQVRIEAPIPGKSAVGIEIPNKTANTVRLSRIIRDRKFTQNKSPLSVALGQTLTGDTLVMDIKKMPHMLIAGATGSGKSVCINTIIISILYHSSPADVRMILIDPKMVELNVYNGIPHLLIPVVTNPKEADGALGWAVREMENRYEQFKENKVKDIDSYNSRMLASGGEKMPHIVLIIDELSDLMMVAAQQVETYICRLAQLARAAGIHLVLATQRPSVNVITGLIKANISSRIAFAVTSQIDSRTILDRGGAEKLLGRGDMLYKPIDENQPVRAQCAFVDDEEIENVVAFIRESSGEASYDEQIQEEIKATAAESPVKQTSAEERDDDGDDETLIRKAMEIAFQNKGKLSTSMIQRKLRVGYSRAGRLVDEMEEKGYISPADGSKPRDVLISYEEFFGNDE